MDLKQYVGCLIKWKNRPAIVVSTRSNYDGDWLYLRYTDYSSGMSFAVNAFDRDLMKVLPDPQYGLLKRDGDNVRFLYKETVYTLTSHPYEPCLYIRKDDSIFRTLHNACDIEGKPEFFAEGNLLHAINGKDYTLTQFCRILASAIDGSRSEMDFPFAARLALN